MFWLNISREDQAINPFKCNKIASENAACLIIYCIYTYLLTLLTNVSMEMNSLDPTQSDMRKRWLLNKAELSEVCLINNLISWNNLHKTVIALNKEP